MRESYLKDIGSQDNFLFRSLSRLFVFFLSVFLVTFSQDAFAASVNDVAQNIVDSSAELPGLVSVFAYILGVILGITGILKLKEHAENPTQVPLRTPVIRLLVGGMLFSLPMIYEAVWRTIGTDALGVDPDVGINSFSGLLGLGSNLIPTLNVNHLLSNFLQSISDTPALVAAIAYLLGLVITVIGVLKLKDHVENPDQTPLKESVIRLLVGGALFAIPTIYNAMFETIVSGGLGTTGSLISVASGFSMNFSNYGEGICTPNLTSALGPLANLFPGASSAGLGQTICSVVFSAGAIPTFLAALAYIIGLVFGLWGILKIRDHVLNPQQVRVSEGVTRLIAGGAFFALPFIVEVARNLIGANFFSTFIYGSSVLNLINNAGSAYNNPIAQACGAAPIGGPIGNLINSVVGTGTVGPGLDCMLAAFMSDIMAPMHVVLNFFAFSAGIIFIMIGISRLIKSAQDGARGPGGVGTIFTFVIGAALISYNELLRAFTGSLGVTTPELSATLSYAQNMGGVEDHAHVVITAILKFVIVIGLISFVRGLFIIRGVAEGNQQASIMAGVTHIVAGAVAVNLGTIINAVQATLGIAQYGIVFS